MLSRRLIAAAAAAAATACQPFDPPAVDMVAVAAGPFFLGCDPEIDPACEGDERPGRDIELAAFEIDRTEVTLAQWMACVADAACAVPADGYEPLDRPDDPVTFVTWDDAAGYCAWAGKRLPTEAEWEKAARGGDGRIYPWGDGAPDCDRANSDGCSDAPAPVASFPGGDSPWGAHDMAGNVMEWVADWYDPAYYAAAPETDPPGPATGMFHGKRGGSYYGDGETVRSSNRVVGFPVGLPNLGLRCAR